MQPLFFLQKGCFYFLLLHFIPKMEKYAEMQNLSVKTVKAPLDCGKIRRIFVLSYSPKG